MTLQLLTQLLNDYQHKEADRIDLPSDPQDVRDLFSTDIISSILASLQQGEADQAKQLVCFAHAIASQTGNPEHDALSAWCHAALHFNRNISKSAEYLERAMRFYSNTKKFSLIKGRILTGYSGQLVQIGRIDDAEIAILQARDCLWNEKEYRDWPILYLNLSTIQFYQAQYKEMLASAQQSGTAALEFEQQYVEQTEYYKFWQVQAIVNQALAKLFLGKLEESKSLLVQSLTLAKPYQWPEVTARARLNLGRAYTLQGDLFSALSTLQQADKDFKIAQIEMDRATVALYQADIYQRLMMPNQARSASVQAAKILTHANIVAEGMEAYLLATQISLSRREAKRARGYLQATEPLLNQVSPFLQTLWHGYASHSALHKNISAKQDALQEADLACIQLEDIGTVAQKLTVALIAAELASQLEKPDTIERYGKIIDQSQAHDLPDLEQKACLQLATHQPGGQSTLLLRRAADILVLKREQMPVEELKANLIGGSLDIYTRLIEAALIDQQIEMATITLLEAKGGIWSDILMPSAAVSMPVEWTQARAELSTWQEEARGTTEPDYLKLCKTKIAQAQKMIAEIARSHERIRVTQPIPSLSEIQATLNEQQVILDYLVGSQQIWVCLISQDDVQWIELSPKSAIERAMSRLNMLLQNLLYIPHATDEVDTISQTRKEIAQSQLDNIQPLLQQLYESLIAPVKQHLQHKMNLSQFFIVPDNYLFELPWTAFYDGQSYLGQQYNLTLLPSTALLAFKSPAETENEPSTNNPPLLLGYPGDPPLLHLADSLGTIQNIWPNAKKINPAQTTDLKWEAVPQWLHIGAHGHVDRRSPLFSQLDLVDGPLLLADIFNLHLHGCDLVTLSACDTGTTPEQGGVIMALAGSFLCAGANNVIATLWPVDDRATTILMRAFYTAYKEINITASQALQMAQKELQNSGFEHPFYWAAFQVFARQV